MQAHGRPRKLGRVPVTGPLVFKIMILFISKSLNLSILYMVQILFLRSKILNDIVICMLLDL
jgi:hypothetical protein